MSNHYDDIAKTVVAGFKSTLNESTRSQITPAQFTELTNAIHKVLSVEKSKVVSQIDAMVKKLRAEVDRPEIEL